MEIIYDVATHKFSHSGFQDLDFKDQNIHIGFRDNGALPVNFSDLSFSIDVTNGSEIIFSDNFPPEGYAIIATDQDEVQQYHICDLVPENEYTVTLVVNNDNHSETFTGKFLISAIKALYPSWVWDQEAGDWVPPVPEPTDGEYYWEESLGQWTPVDEMIKRTFGDE